MDSCFVVRNWGDELTSPNLRFLGVPLNCHSWEGLSRPSFDSKDIHVAWTNFWNSCYKSSQQRTLGHSSSLPATELILHLDWIQYLKILQAGWQDELTPKGFSQPHFHISTSHFSVWLSKLLQEYLPQRPIIKRDSRGQRRSGACIHEDSEMKIPSQP